MQVTLNICSNAVKYTFSGSIKITIGISKDFSYLSIKVEDTGIGIAELELKQLNNLFGLLDRKLMYSETGIGMGLAVSKGIVNEMKGTLKIVSKVNI